MRDIDARVTGFKYTTFHAYITEVEVDDHTWTLSIRYSAFYQFYERLLTVEKYFPVEFPPKGGLFFSPPPEKRQEELDEFMLGTLAYFDMRGHPKRMGALLDEFLEITKHLIVKDEEDERTASEGSFDVIDDFLANGHDTVPQPIVADENQVKAVVKLGYQGLKAEIEDEVQAHVAVKSNCVELDTKTKAREANDLRQRMHTKDKVSVMSTMKESIDKHKAAMLEKSTEVQQSIKDDNAMKKEVVIKMQEKNVAVVKVEEKSATSMIKNMVTHKEATDATPIQTAIETRASSSESKEYALEPVMPIEGDHGNVLNTVSILDPESEQKMVKENELFLQEEGQKTDLESWKENTEFENPVVGWFRRFITFGSFSDGKEAQGAAQKQYEEESEQGDQEKQEAAAQAETKAVEADACAQTEVEVKAEAMEAELLLAAQELDLRLKRYRHPIFFRDFNCDVKASRFFMLQRLSSAILV